MFEMAEYEIHRIYDMGMQILYNLLRIWVDREQPCYLNPKRLQL